mgnify:CR=1 FL=1
MYIIGIMVMAVGLIPLILAKFIFNVFRGTQLSTPLSIYMALMFCWQVDIGILYFHELLPQEIIIWIFKIFRFATMYAIPATVYLSYKMFNEEMLRNDNKTLFDKFLTMLVSKQIFWATLIGSTILYIINLTSYGVSEMRYVTLLYSKDLYYLYPNSSPIQGYIFGAVVILSIIVIISSFISLGKVQSITIKRFMTSFFLYATLLILCGPINLIPQLGSLVSSIAVIVFSVGIMLSFFRVHLEQNEQYRMLVERERKMDYMGSITSSLIHEIRNPLHIAKNFTILLDKTENLSENGKECIDYINSATNQLENIVESFTDYMDNKKLELGVVDLNEIIENAIYLTRENARENDVQVIFEKKYQKLKIEANRTFIQVLINIIKNCAESIPEGKLQRTINIDTVYHKGFVYINIKDTGKGIPKDQWDKIFHPFVSNKKNGMGIGLAFSRKIMYEHNGDLKVVDSSSEGTEFQITIPQYNIW